jgi:hypothetical protein
MGISTKMAERLISSLFNRIRYPFLYTQPKKLNAAYPPILSHKDLFLEMNLLAMAREVSTSMKRFKKRFLNEEDDEDEQINIITEYILAEEYHSFTQSKLAYELGEMDMDEDIYRREHYLPLYREIMRDKENQIEAFKVFLDGTIAYLDETSKVPISIAYLIDAIAEKIVPFLELEFLTDKLDEMIEKKNSYIAKVHLKEEIEWDEIKVHVEGVIKELEEGRDLYELYKVLREGNAISLFLNNAHSPEHKNIIRQYLAYDKDLALEIKTPEPLIDLWIAVENDREHYHRLSDEARKIAEILGLTVEVPFV